MQSERQTEGDSAALPVGHLAPPRGLVHNGMVLERESGGAHGRAAAGRRALDGREVTAVRFEKKSLCAMNMPYALGRLELDGEQCVVAATEDHGPVVVMRPPYREASELVPGPGGCMALIADREHPATLFAVMGCFLGYKFQEGGVYRIRRSPEEGGRKSSRGGEPGRAGADRAGEGATFGFSATKILDLPFAHRIELVDRPSGRYLIAAALAADKRDPADWSQPGALYAAPVPSGADLDARSSWRLVPILEGIHKNHGLLATRFQGRRAVLLSGSEGLFVLDLEAAGEGWSSRLLLEREISELAVFDVDGDGRDELITIEPFHGSALRVYRESAAQWELVWEAELAYGHCLWAGEIAGKRCILVSNRSASRDLILFQFAGPQSGETLAPERVVVDAGAGSANMLVLKSDGVERIFATNQGSGEVAVYSVASGS